MNVAKQMCWCFKVVFGVFINLAQRLFSEISEGSYEMCSKLCWLCRSRNRSNFAADDCESAIKPSPREEFYRDVPRSEAEQMLRDRQNGTFVIRPSKHSSLGTISLIQDHQIFHLNIRRRGDNAVALGSEKMDEKSFRDVNSLINYYVSNYLVIYSKNGGSTATLLLPYREKKEKGLIC